MDQLVAVWMWWKFSLTIYQENNCVEHLMPKDYICQSQIEGMSSWWQVRYGGKASQEDKNNNNNNNNNNNWKTITITVID